jgi:cysteine desulfurase
MHRDAELVTSLSERFLAVVRSHHPDVRTNGHPLNRLNSNLSLTFPGVDADHVVGALQPRVALSTSAACTAGVLQPSHVLVAVGLSSADADSTIRVGFGRFNTVPEIDAAAELLCLKISDIRAKDGAQKAATACFVSK